ncbi:FAD-binding domain-containing protein [Hypoxylon rubiginosum]|uniref:FAD-binding domain-containing protein n=1 Tax=Hypoxylon rubiginosum TaxID=110542 RepID=A0ACC0CRL9_9PEZI|nr:FAD-binding domain-containing protein [Hypoxylon rubiginosum]
MKNNITEAIKYANELDLPFLAVSSGHGAITTAGKLQNGVEIWLNQLKNVKIADDGLTAKIGGGTRSKAVTDTLWAAGKQTVTGVCECVSILGPGLGGGHGLLQGRYGLMSDQFVSMDVVLADGSIHTIDDKEYSDLWWAMKGAGHNFAVVTSVTSKIYDIQHRDWAYQLFMYTGDKVEGLFRTINEQLPNNGTRSVGIINLAIFLNNPDVDPTRPVVVFYLLQEGVTEVDPTYTTPFHNLEPIFTDTASGLYTDVPGWLTNSNESPFCQKTGLVNTRFPIDIEVYNTTAQVAAYELFASRTQEFPALNNSAFLFEGYTLQGVQAIPGESSAYPFRMDNLLVSPVITYVPAINDPELDNTAAKLGRDLRQILHEGSQREEMHTYVNYAFGDESTQNWYGYEQWRQDRLSALKRKYDPNSKFSFYAPIA